MSEARHLSEALIGLFAARQQFWFAAYPDTVEGLSAQQAACSPGPRLNSVWAITLHLEICQRFALVLLRGEMVDPQSFFTEGAWPPVPSTGEAVWEAAKNALLETNRSLAECVAGLPESVLEAELPAVGMKAYAYIQGQIAHNSHHLNEIINTRHMLGLWLENT